MIRPRPEWSLPLDNSLLPLDVFVVTDVSVLPIDRDIEFHPKDSGPSRFTRVMPENRTVSFHSSHAVQISIVVVLACVKRNISP